MTNQNDMIAVATIANDQETIDRIKGLYAHNDAASGKSWTDHPISSLVAHPGMHSVKPVKYFIFDEAEAANGTGYYDGLVDIEFPGVEHGSILLGYSVSTKRRVVVITTSLGNLVMFDRYSEAGNGVVVKNVPRIFNGLVPSSSINIDASGPMINLFCRFDALAAEAHAK